MNTMKNGSALLAGLAVSLLAIGCSDGLTTPSEQDLGLAFSMGADHPVVLIIDEESIDNGNHPPNFFSAADVNDDIAAIGLRTELSFFADADHQVAGVTFTLHTGQVGDEVDLPRIGGRLSACVFSLLPRAFGVRSFRCAGGAGE